MMRRLIPIPAGVLRIPFVGPRLARGPGSHSAPQPAPAWWRPTRRGRVLLGLLGPAVVLVFLSTGAALAYWVTTDSSNPAAAAAGTLLAPTGGSQTAATPGSVSISWTAPSGYTPTSYTVSRCTGNSCTPSTAITSGGCSGVITATSCTDTDGDLAPGQTYTYAVTAILDNWVSTASAAFQGSTTPAAGLGFTVQPGPGANVQATGTGTFTVRVAIQDSDGNTVTSDNTDDVTLAIDNNPSAGVLSCTNPGNLTVQAVAGVAQFTGCSITEAGHGYTLTASSNATPTLTAPTNENSFNIVAGAPSQFVFTTSPLVGPPSSSADLGPLTVQLQDQNGNVATAGAGGVPVNLSASPAIGAVFSATSGGPTVTSVTVGSGSSTGGFFFGDTAPGSPKVTAASPGLTSANQTETVGADQLVFTSPPFSGTASASPVDGPVTVQLQNALGAPITTGATVSLSSDSTGINEFAASSGGPAVTSVTIPPASSSVSFYYGDELAGSPTITASAPGVTQAMQLETINAGPAAGLSFSNVSTNSGPATTTCTGVVGSVTFGCTISPESAGDSDRFLTGDITLIDQFQNPTTSASDVSVSLSQNGGTGVAPPTLTILAGTSTSAGTFTESLTPSVTGQGTVTATATVNSALVQAQITS